MTQRRRRGYRWIIVDGVLWQWKARRGFDAIGPNGEHIRVDRLDEYVGDLERGKRKGTEEGIVLPSLAAQLIRDGLLAQAAPEVKSHD